MPAPDILWKGLMRGRLLSKCPTCDLGNYIAGTRKGVIEMPNLYVARSLARIIEHQSL